MKTSPLLAALAVIAIGSAHSSRAGEIVNIDGTTSIGTTIDLTAGTYDVTYAGIAGGGEYDGYSLAMNGSTPVRFTDELSITIGGSTDFTKSPTYNYIVNGVQQNYSTAAAALTAYKAALASGTLSESSSYDPQNYVTTVNKISFTLLTAGAVTFTAPDLYTFGPVPNYDDNTGGVSILVTQVPEPASLAVLGAGLFGVGMVRRRTRA